MRYEAESIFSKVEDLISTAFLKMISTTDIYSESCKAFWTTISREALSFKLSQGITDFTGMIGFTFLWDQSDH